MKKIEIIFSTFALIALLTPVFTVSAADYSNIHLTTEEEMLIATLSYFETEREPLLSKVSFCAMILNRLQSEYFPDNVRQVVFDGGAFESAMAGKLSNPPSREELSSDLLALRQVLRKNLDPTCGALFTMKTDDPCLWEIMVLFTVDNRAFGIIT